MPNQFTHPTDEKLAKSRSNGAHRMSAEIFPYPSIRERLDPLFAAETKAMLAGKRTYRECGDDFRIRVKIV